MINIFAVPDKEKDFQGYMVYVLVILWQVIVSIIVSIGFLFFPNLWTRWTGFVVVSLLIAASNLTINRLGYTRLASWAFTIMLWLQITIPCFSAGGIMAPGILSQMSVILTAGFLLGWRGGLAVGLLTIGSDFGMAYLEVIGKLPVPTIVHNPITRWIGAIIPFGTILSLQYYATNHLRTSLVALQREIKRREEAETTIKQTVYNLEERVKELKTLYAVSRILQNEETSLEQLVYQVAETLPSGWQYPDITAAKVCIAAKQYTTPNYMPSPYTQLSEMKTDHGTMLSLEVVYLKEAPPADEGPFLKEERSLINMVCEMVKMNIEWRERRAELKDYKYALNLGSIVSIAAADGHQTFVNDNFCKISKFSAEELIGEHFSIISSGVHSPEYFADLAAAMKDGKPYRGEFCNKAKDGTLYWVDTTIVPFLDESGKVYQYLSINQDITERKEANEKIRQSEQLLRKITSQVPGNTYLFEIEESGHSIIHFISRGTDSFNHNYEFDDLSARPEELRGVLYDEDKDKFNEAMQQAYRTNEVISFQYRIVVQGSIRWRWMQAIPEKGKDGKTLWYGATSDITPLVDYIASIEQVIFDIGHVIRRPVATMLGMSKLIVDNSFSEDKIREISKKFYFISQEMDKFIKELNQVYEDKRQITNLNIDITSLIDKRSSLFN